MFTLKSQSHTFSAIFALAVVASTSAHAAPQLSTARTSQHTRKPLVNITLALPQLTGKGASNFNAAVKAATDKEIASFKNDVSEYSKSPPDPPYDKGANTLEIKYQVKFANARYISLLMSKYIDFPGAAHPSSGTYMLTYDLDAQHPVTLGALFKPGAPYLRTIARYCTNVLHKRLSDEFEASGTQPTTQNFSHWNLTRQGLLVTFDAYQVASYARGPQTVMIPYATLRPMMKPTVLAGLK